MPRVSVIVSTYNKPQFLEKVLTGYSKQTFQDFEILIADDGSRKETKELVKKFDKNFNQKIIHIWHEDNGFRKCKILNQAISQSNGEYIVFSDGDCIPKSNFLEIHVKSSKKGYFLSGGHFPINERVSNKISLNDILSQKCFSKRFLLLNGQSLNKNFFKIIYNYQISKLFDFLTPTRTTFNGNNSSAWKEDIVNAKGFDERMEYGGLDCELGYRLGNNGIRSIQIRNRSTVLHLYHTRPYKNKEAIKVNRKIRENTLRNNIVFTENGLK